MLLHAILTSYSKKYRDYSIEEKNNYINNMKDRIINDMTPEQCFEQWNESLTEIIKKKTRIVLLKFFNTLKKI